MRIVIVLCFFTFFLFSCQNEDICLEPGTPRIIMTFNDIDTVANKKEVPALYVYPKDSLKGGRYNGVTTDSIAIDMDLGPNETNYTFETEDMATNLKFSYIPENEYISRACGFKVTFKNLEVSNDYNSWIKNITVINDTITDESKIALIIYH